jgi:CHAD domain-containing protein
MSGCGGQNFHQPFHRVRRRRGLTDAIQSCTEERRQDRIHMIHYTASDTIGTCRRDISRWSRHNSGCVRSQSRHVLRLRLYSMRRHIDVITARCYATLRQLRAVRRYMSQPVMQSLVMSSVLSRLDHFEYVLFGLAASSIQWLQMVQNAAGRLVCYICHSDHVTEARICLHWLRVAERIRFKMAVTAFRSIHGLSSTYLHEFVPYQAGRRG